MDYLAAGFDVGVVGTFTVTLDESGQSPADASITTGTYCPLDISSVMGSGNYTSWITAVAAALTTASPAGNTYSGSWNATTRRYTISRASGSATFDLTFSGDAGRRAREALGFSADTSSGGTSHTSDQTPHYVIVPNQSGFEDPSRRHELGETVTGAVTYAGTDHAFERGVAAQGQDFKVAFESLEATFTPDPLPSNQVPWTWEQFVKSVRASRPFAIVEGATTTVLRLQPKRATFSQEFRTRRVDNFDGWWDINLRSYYLGGF